MYRVTHYFTDLQDNGYIYDVDSIYPRVGYTPTVTRIEELCSTKNRQRTPLIAEINRKSKKQKKNATND